MIKTSEKVEPKIYAYTTPNNRDNNGYIKIGYTEQDVYVRINQQSHTIHTLTHLEWSGSAFYNDNPDEPFHDSDFHTYLTRNDIARIPDTEWFRISARDSELLFETFKNNRGFLETEGVLSYKLRKEQKDAIKKAEEYFANNKEFLFNAKPRFGKTLTTYALTKELNANNVLILTNRPAIANSWYDDYVKFMGTQSGYWFFSDSSSLKNRNSVYKIDKYNERKELTERDNNTFKSIVFVSLQDLKGSVYFGGEKNKLKEIKDTEWDLLVLDEAHEGVDTFKTNILLDIIKAKRILHLSGTPFKALANGKFPENAIFNWTYSDEQKAKSNFPEDSDDENPYANLPKLNMYTYKLSSIVGIAENSGVSATDNLSYAFNLNEFFQTDTKGRFLHDAEVDKFLATLTTDEKFPFSTDDLRNELKHTLWLLNRVGSAKALYDKLTQHPQFHDYKIILAAGNGRPLSDEGSNANDREIKNIYDRVTREIRENDKTITISVGQLTTGVTIPEWSAVLMLSSVKSPALYMQTMFRVQSPWFYRVGNEYFRKRNAYIFDFEPSRTLILYDEIANKLNEDVNQQDNVETHRNNIAELINYLPVIGEDVDGSLINYDAEKVLSLPNKLKDEEVVRCGFMSDLLLQNLDNILNGPQEIADILNKTKKRNKSTTVTIRPNKEDDNTDSRNDNTNIPIDRRVAYAEDIQNMFNPFLTALSSPNANVDTIIRNLKEAIVCLIISKEENNYDIQVFNKCRNKIKADINIMVERILRNTAARVRIAYINLDSEERERTSRVQSEDERNEIINEIKLRKREWFSTELKTDFEESADDFINNIQPKIKEIYEEQIKKQQDAQIKDTIKAHLLSFLRVFPSLLMAYGTEETTLSNFDTICSSENFNSISDISVDEFRLLRDGGDIPTSDGSSIHFEGKLFNEIVFNNAVKEFIRKKKALSNYLDENIKDDIFNYIPSPKTNLVYTPRSIVEDMLSKLETESPNCFDNPNSTFADLYIKSGLYLAGIVKRLYNSEEIRREYPNNKERINHIFSKQIYGCAPNDVLYRISTNYLFGIIDETEKSNNIICLDTIALSKDGVLEETLKKKFHL